MKVDRDVPSKLLPEATVPVGLMDGPALPPWLVPHAMPERGQGPLFHPSQF